MRRTGWALAICFAAVTALCFRYAFTVSNRFLNHDHDVFACCGNGFQRRSQSEAGTFAKF